MALHLKQGKDAAARAEADQQVRDTVEGILDDIDRVVTAFGGNPDNFYMRGYRDHFTRGHQDGRGELPRSPDSPWASIGS